MTRPTPRTRDQYLNWVRATVSFSTQWSFNHQLTQNTKTQADLTHSMEGYAQVRDAQGNLPVAQVRPHITLTTNDRGKLYADYDGWCNCGYIQEEMQSAWRDVFDLCEEIKAIPHGTKGLRIATRIVVYRDSGSWSAAVALGDPQEVLSKLTSARNRLSREAALYGTEHWEEYLRSRYGQ